jgi:putative ABC transport system substrate-binding protein
MRPVFALFTAFAAAVLLCSFAGHAEAAACEIVVVQSSEIKPFQQALDAFEETSGCIIKEVIFVQSSSSDLSARVRRLNPDGVLALGLDALSRIQYVKDIPIFYTMAANLPLTMQAAENVSGVSMIIAPDRQIESIRRLLPQARRVGVLYDPSSTGQFVQDLIKAARAKSIEVVAVKTRSAQEVARLLDQFKDRIDVLLMPPDLTVVTPQTVEAMMLFSFQNLVPVISFSEKFVSMGALSSIMMVPADIGVQTGELVRAYFTQKGAGLRVREYARKSFLIVNPKIAKKFKILLSSEILKESKKVE